jgi:hypothetical protein
MLPEVGRCLGKSIVEFKKGIKGLADEAEAGDQAEDAAPPVRRRDAGDVRRREPPRKRKVAGAARRPRGLIGRLLDLFGRDRTDEPAPSDRAAFRPRAEDLLRRLQAAPPDAPGRLALLRTLVDELEALFKDLVSAGDHELAVARLGRVLVEARTLLKAARAEEADVNALWGQLGSALQGWLALTDPGGAAQREPFWK